jgi:hypothetical protein
LIIRLAAQHRLPAGEYGGRNLEAERLGGGEVDDQLARADEVLE